MGECAYTVNGVDAGFCVLESCLTHAWVFAMVFQFGVELTLLVMSISTINAICHLHHRHVQE